MTRQLEILLRSKIIDKTNLEQMIIDTFPALCTLLLMLIKQGMIGPGLDLTDRTRYIQRRENKRHT
jgi:hypothetical protein